MNYFTGLSLVACMAMLAGCGTAQDNGWTKDCQTYHSETKRQLKECQKRAEENRPMSAEQGSVSLDPLETDPSIPPEDKSTYEPGV